MANTQIKVKSLTGRVNLYEFANDEKATLGMLKQLVQDHEGIPPPQQRFLPITAVEFDTLPYGDDKINKYVKENENRYLKGNNKQLSELGVVNNSILLMVLSLRGSDEDEDVATETKKEENPVEELYRKVVFEDYLLTEAEINDLVENLKKEDNLEVITTMTGIIRNSYVFNSKTIANTRTVESLLPLLEATTNLEVAQEYVSLFHGVARSKIDGIIVKAIELGILKSLKRLFEAAQSNKFTLTKLQGDIVSLLENFQREHEPCTPEIAELLYKDNFEKNELVTVPDFISYSHEYRLWGAPLAYFNEIKNVEVDYLIVLNEVSGLDLAAKDKNGLSDPYFEAGAAPSYDESFKALLKSSVQKKTLNPIWKMKDEKKISFAVGHNVDATILIYDQDMLKDEYMGSITFSPAELFAIQQKAKASPTQSITYSMKVESIERKKKNIKIHEVSGYLIVNMHISQAKKI